MRECPQVDMITSQKYSPKPQTLKPETLLGVPSYKAAPRFSGTPDKGP